MKWVLSWGNHTWSEDDLTIAHLVLICQGLGEDTWDITPTAGPMKLLAVLAAFISIAESVPLNDVMVAIAAVPVEQLLAGLQIVEE